MDLARGRLGAQQVLGGQHLIDRLERMDDPLRVEDRDLLAARRIAELDSHEEPGESLGQDGLAGAGNVLHEDVAAAHERDQRELDLVVFAENDPLDVLHHAVDLRRESFLHRATYPSSLKSAAAHKKYGSCLQNNVGTP